jgi:hypothetical protein
MLSATAGTLSGMLRRETGDTCAPQISRRRSRSAKRKVSRRRGVDRNRSFSRWVPRAGCGKAGGSRVWGNTRAPGSGSGRTMGAVVPAVALYIFVSMFSEGAESIRGGSSSTSHSLLSSRVLLARSWCPGARGAVEISMHTSTVEVGSVHFPSLGVVIR